MSRNLSAISLLCGFALVGCNSAGPTESKNAALPPPVPKIAPTAAPISKSDLVGRWNSVSTGPSRAKSQIEFKKDGSFVTNVHAEKNGIKLARSTTGTYKVSGNVVTLHLTGMATTSSDPATQKKLDPGNKAAKEAIRAAKDASAKLEWKDKDTAVVTTIVPPEAPSGVKPLVTTLTRVKD